MWTCRWRWMSSINNDLWVWQTRRDAASAPSAHLGYTCDTEYVPKISHRHKPTRHHLHDLLRTCCTICYFLCTRKLQNRSKWSLGLSLLGHQWGQRSESSRGKHTSDHYSLVQAAVVTRQSTWVMHHVYRLSSA